MPKFSSVDFLNLQNYNPPENWIKILTLDAHTGGEPLRIFLKGYPELKGKTILEKRRFAKENYDYLRTALMFEPRGHADMYGCILTEPVTEEADFGILFLHNEGYSTMCGHAIIAITKVAVETGFVKLVEPETQIKIDSPAGLITSYAKIKNGKVEEVYFHNVPSFVQLINEEIEVEGLGKVKFDIAFGGAFYAFVDADELGISMTPENYRQLIEKGMDIKRAVMKNYKLKHPFDEDLNFLYGTIFTGKALNKNADSRNVCIFAEGEVDRSPTGTGVSARMALHYAKGEIKLNEVMVIESILGTTFKASPIKETTFGDYKAVIPEVSGTAFITGRNEFWIDPEDPLKHGFILR
ncbi:MAG: proline racemase [Ignavibacteria bacterium GWB2_35_6b]|nr:MAG: proline racemase [Ignavibacteria bacterium GWB2_35_6b]